MADRNHLHDQDLWRTRPIVHYNGQWTVDGLPRTRYQLLRIERPSNIPGKSYVAILITVPPHSATPPHSHNGAAVYAQVIKGEVISQMIHSETMKNSDGSVEIIEHDSGVNVYRSGEMWYEAPGCHHVRSENAGKGEAQFFANFIIDTDKLDTTNDSTVAASLTILDVDPKSPYYKDSQKTTSSTK